VQVGFFYAYRTATSRITKAVRSHNEHIAKLQSKQSGSVSGCDETSHKAVKVYKDWNEVREEYYSRADYEENLRLVYSWDLVKLLTGGDSTRKNEVINLNIWDFVEDIEYKLR